ncbi:MAG: hypothetical protein J7L34_01100 [Thermotogaceae bacterium]|nr:hypothetical protein [Thermotogaceae bacterium]
MKKILVFAFVFLLIGVVYSAKYRIGLTGDFPVYTLESTPLEASMMGAQFDFVLISPGNVQMGFGLGYEMVSADAGFLGTPVDHSLELYSVASFKSELSSTFDLLVISRGGMSVPNHDFSLSGYFVEVSADLVYYFKWFYVLAGLSIKSYAFGDAAITFIPIKLGFGGEY